MQYTWEKDWFKTARHQACDSFSDRRQFVYIILLKWMDPPITTTQLASLINGTD
jgi:hypothetical protein